MRDDPDGAAGLWVAVRGLPRPERAEVVNTRNRRKVVVALFAAPGSGPDDPPLQRGRRRPRITEATPVRITALRREAQIDTTKGR